MLEVYKKLLQIAHDNKLEVEETDLIGGDNSGLKGVIVMFRQPGKYKVNGIIGIASRLSLEEKAITLAHELGHFFLKHEGNCTVKVDKRQEEEAEAFGLQLIEQIKHEIFNVRGE